jgi:hypothetical protein
VLLCTGSRSLPSGLLLCAFSERAKKPHWPQAKPAAAARTKKARGQWEQENTREEGLRGLKNHRGRKAGRLKNHRGRPPSSGRRGQHSKRARQSGTGDTKLTKTNKTQGREPRAVRERWKKMRKKNASALEERKRMNAQEHNRKEKKGKSDAKKSGD